MSTGRPPEPLRRGSKPSTRPWHTPTQVLQTTTTMHPSLHGPGTPPSTGPCRSRPRDSETKKPRHLRSCVPGNKPPSCPGHIRRRAFPAANRLSPTASGPEKRSSTHLWRSLCRHTRTSKPKRPSPPALRRTPSSCPCRSLRRDRRTTKPKRLLPSGRGNTPTNCLWYILRADLRDAPHNALREGSRDGPREGTARRRFRRHGRHRSTACRPEGEPARSTGLTSTFSSCIIGLLLPY